MAEAPAMLRCPSCGAPASPEARKCPYCASTLALVACPSCFASIFEGARHCSSCGAEVSREAGGPRAARTCPECRRDMVAVRVGSVTLDECAACGGVFVDPPAFERICAEREQQAVVLRTDFPAPRARAPQADRYWPCPRCERLMNRQNFARLSGVIVDVCRGHGVWFNHGELQRIVEFIRAGGLERSREREKEEVREALGRLRDEQRAQALRGAMTGPGVYNEGGGSPDYAGMLSAARDLLRGLFE